MSNPRPVVRRLGRRTARSPDGARARRTPPGLIYNGKGMAMADHKTGTRAEWQAARDELARLEAKHAELNGEIKRKRLELPWVPVEKKYEFDTETGRRTLADLFEGRSQ